MRKMADDDNFGRLPEWVSKALELMDEVRRENQLRKLESEKGKGKDKDAKPARP